MATDTWTKPALSNEEWARREVEFDDDGKPGGWVAHEGMVVLRSDTFEAVPDSFDTLGTNSVYVGTYNKKGVATRWGIRLRPHQRHATAALCLHGQPFGFTREDVETILAGALALREDGCDLLSAELAAIADRVGALLPPESA